ncbi:MAG: DUF1992 domain-containing protein [Chloroflexi bacterium]|nr:DUF1992 domain-containing protein [Chloroflexota bacterium]
MVAPATEPGASPPPWHIIAERKIQEWIDRGGLDRLPRRGAIRIEERPFVPLELRMACDILERSGFAPDWVVLGKEIETETSDAREAMRRWRFAADRAGSIRRTVLRSSGSVRTWRAASHTSTD